MNAALKVATPGVKRSESDAELVHASRSGDREAFAELVDRYHAAVTATVCSLPGGSALVEEVAQETFGAAWRQLGQLRRPEQFRHWIYGIARNLTRRVQRDECYQSARNVAPVAVPDGVMSIMSVEPTPLDRMINREQEKTFADAFLAIPERYRVPLLMFYREQQTLLQIGQALDLSTTCVKTRLRRGRLLLTEQMADFLETSAHWRKRPRRLAVAAVMATIAGIPPGAAEAVPGGSGGVWRMSRGGLHRAAASLSGVAAVGAVLYWGGLVPSGSPTGAQILLESSAMPKWSPEMGRPEHAGTLDGDAQQRRTPALPVYDLDFEDRILPSVFSQGHVVPCGGGRENQHCLVATVRPWWGQRNAVTLGDPMNANEAAFHYSKSMVISFDYWLGADAAHPVKFEVADYAIREKFIRWFYETPPQTWTHVEIPLADLEPTDPKSPAMRDGDPIRTVTIEGGEIGGQPFYIDNLKLTQQEGAGN